MKGIGPKELHTRPQDFETTVTILEPMNFGVYDMAVSRIFSKIEN